MNFIKHISWFFILLFHLSTIAELNLGEEVVFKNVNGQFEVGKVNQVYGSNPRTMRISMTDRSGNIFDLAAEEIKYEDPQDPRIGKKILIKEDTPIPVKSLNQREPKIRSSKKHRPGYNISCPRCCDAKMRKACTTDCCSSHPFSNGLCACCQLLAIVSYAPLVQPVVCICENCCKTSCNSCYPMGQCRVKIPHCSSMSVPNNAGVFQEEIPSYQTGTVRRVFNDIAKVQLEDGSSGFFALDNEFLEIEEDSPRVNTVVLAPLGDSSYSEGRVVAHFKKGVLVALNNGKNTKMLCPKRKLLEARFTEPPCPSAPVPSAPLEEAFAPIPMLVELAPYPDHP